MLFSALARSFRELEGISGRRVLVQTLAELFRAAEGDEVPAIAYLLQGRLAPAFVPREMGMGPRHVAQAIAQAYGTERDAVLAEFDRTGDLGTVAGQLAEQRGGPYPAAESASVTSVFARLVEIAEQAGAGSIEKKVGAFAALLAPFDPCSATYICRIPLGTLRLGVGDLTILDAYSVAQAGTTSLRPQLEHAYNDTSNLGVIGRTLWEGGIEAVAALGITVANPVRPMLAERLSSAEAIVEKLGRCAVENKYDGVRCQVHKAGSRITVFSRNLEETTHAFPEIVAGAQQQITAHTAIFEGEALAFNPLTDEYLPFQQTVRRRRKHDVAETAESLPLRLFAFDVLYVDGENLTSRSYVERRATLERLVGVGDAIQVAESLAVDSAAALTARFELAIGSGLEGIVAKKLDSPYVAGARSYNWVKLKRAQAGHLRDTLDCVIIGYLYGRGRRAALGVGALLVAVYDRDRDLFSSITKIGTGLSDEEWRSIRERCAPYAVEHKPARVESTIVPSVWVEPALVVEVLADEITRSPLYTAGAHDGRPGYALRFPRLVAFRDADKGPEEATTVAEVVELYQLQRGGRQPGV